MKRNTLLSLMIIPIVLSGCGSKSPAETSSISTSAPSEASVEISTSPAVDASSEAAADAQSVPDAESSDPSSSSSSTEDPSASVSEDMAATESSEAETAMSISFAGRSIFQNNTHLQDPQPIDMLGISRVSVINTEYPTEYYAQGYVKYLMNPSSGDDAYIDYVINKNWATISKIAVLDPYITVEVHLAPESSDDSDITPEFLESGKKVYVCVVDRESGEIDYLPDDAVSRN